MRYNVATTQTQNAEKEAYSMNSIALNDENEKHFSSQIEEFFSRYQIGSILKRCNTYKKQGIPVVRIVGICLRRYFLAAACF